MNYTGLECPVCSKVFAESDDIVVCPKCGAPYHRACYQEAGHCLYEEKHGTSAAWQRPKEEPIVEEPSRCPRCGKPNLPNTLFCDQCGQSLLQSKDSQGYASPFSNPHPPYQNPQNIQPPPFIFDPMGGVNPDTPIGGVAAGEVAKLVQSSTSYYLPVFKNLKNSRTNRFNFCAFAFSGGWLLYRKQYKIGAILTAIMLTLYTVSTYLSYNVNRPIVLDLMQRAGVNPSTKLINFKQYSDFADLIMQQDPMKVLLLFLPAILGFMRFGIMMYLGFNGNRIYLNYCLKKVEAIQASTPAPADRMLQYQTQGGVNTSLAICLLVCYMIVVYVPQLFLY